MATDQESEIARSIAATTGLPLEDAAALAAGVGRKSARDYGLRLQWVVTLASVTRAIVTEHAEPFGLFESVFWIRLYGTLHELPDDFATWRKISPDDSDVPPLLASMLRSEKRIHDACGAVRAALSERELMYATLARHTAAHVTQDSFAYRYRAGNANRPAAVHTSVTLPIVDATPRPVDFVIESCRALVAEHGEEDAVTRAIAAKVNPRVDALAAVMRAHHLAMQNLGTR